MFTNTKLLISVSVFIIIFGFGFLYVGLKPNNYVQPVTIFVSPIPENTLESTKSARPLTSKRSDGEQATQGLEGEKVLVTKVVDGDTIYLETGETVRFIGIDTPETVDPRRPVGCFGKEASNETKNLLTGKEVILQKDITNTDKYKRLLRYIYLPLDDEKLLFVNDYLVREGFAKVYTYPPDTKFDIQFKEAEIQAKQFKKGMWGKC